MSVAELEAAVATLAEAVSRSPQVEEEVRAWWRTAAPTRGSLSSELAGAADVLSRELPRLSQTTTGVSATRPFFAGPGGPVVLSWCSASAWRLPDQAAIASVWQA